jgi:hypothetical protein
MTWLLRGLLIIFAVAIQACTSGKDGPDGVARASISLGNVSSFLYSTEMSGSDGTKCFLDIDVNLISGDVGVELGGQSQALSFTSSEKSALRAIFDDTRICPPCLNAGCHQPPEQTSCPEFINVFQNDTIYTINCMSPLCNATQDNQLWSTFHTFAERNGLTSCP